MMRNISIFMSLIRALMGLHGMELIRLFMNNLALKTLPFIIPIPYLGMI